MPSIFFCIKRFRKIIFLMIFSYCFIHYLTRQKPEVKKKGPYDDIDFSNRTSLARYKAFILHQALKRDKGIECNRLNIIQKVLLQSHRKDYKQIALCNSTDFDWVKCHLSRCKISLKVYERYENVRCGYTGISYDNQDKMSDVLSTLQNVQEGEFNLTTHDHVMIMCIGKKKNIRKIYETAKSKGPDQKRWFGFGTGFRKNLIRSPPPLERENTPNILILAIESLSSIEFSRKMPNTYYVLKNHLGAVVLNGYNIVGDGTVGNLFPFLTGHHDIELPDARNDVKGTSYLDRFPFIFYELRKDGYRTAYFELPLTGTFHLRHNGFQEQPTDHYLRPFFIMERNTKFIRRIKSYCLSDTLTYSFMLNQTEQVHLLDGKKFSFTHIGDIPYAGISTITIADNHVADFLKRARHFTNTLIVVMGVHSTTGYTQTRNNFYGKFDERHPFMAIVLPQNILENRPDALTNLKENAEVLTTPFDMHTTLLDVAELNYLSNPYDVPGSAMIRGLSLLDEIPNKRSCSEAGIEPHWCPCLKWKSVDPTDPIYTAVVNKFIEFVNDYTNNYRKLCAIRELISIENVQRQVLHYEFLDDSVWRRYVGLFNISEPTIEFYQIKVVLSPGNAIYKATINLVEKYHYFMEPHDVSRLDSYAGERIKCIENPFVDMYCYCN